jgi:hypothetical protein
MTDMQFFELDEPTITTSQRWSQYLTIAWGVVALLIVFNVRAGVLSATSTYVNNEVGIVAEYPAAWLVDEESDEYVFRVRDMQRIGHKTTFQVSLRPVSAETSARTIVDTLAIQRAQTLAAYTILSTESFALSEDPNAQQITYTYVDTTANPFLESVPTVVVGVDIVAISRGQAVVITLLSDEEDIDANRERFLEFVNRLEF